MALSIAGTSASYILFAIAVMQKNLPLLFVARAIDGFTGGNIAVAQAAIGDISTNENRTKNFGIMGAAFGLGFVVGPYLGGRLSAPHTSFYGMFDTPGWFGASTPFWFAAILAGLNCLAILSLFPETIKVKIANRKMEFGRSIQNVIQGFRSPRLRVPLLTSFLFVGGFTFFTTFSGVYLAREFGFTQAKTGDFFALVGIFIALSQGLLVGMVAKKMADYRVLKWSLLCNAGALLVWFVAKSTWPLYLGLPFFCFFNACCMANLSGLISRSAEMGHQGEAMGIYSSVQSLSQVPAAVLVGYITSGADSKAPLAAAAIIMLLAGVVYNLFFKPTYVSTGMPTGAPSTAAAH